MSTDTRVVADLLPRSRWRALRGPHAGAVVEVLGINKAGRVRVHSIGGEGRNVGNGHFDEAVKGLLAADQFLATYTLAMPAPSVSQAPLLDQPPAVPTQPAFRQANKRGRPPKPAPTPVVVPTVGEINTRDAEFNVSLETITPDRAKEWLARGGLNRHLNLERVEGLAAAIRRNEWRQTGDTIKLDKEGRVRDGQHRLHAIAISQAVRTLVAFGVDEEAFDVMDTGKSRTIADIVGMRGFPSRNGLASAVRSLILFDTSQRLVGKSRDTRELVTSASTLAYLRDYTDVLESLHVADTVRLEFPGGIGLWSALIYLFRRVNPAAADDFIRALTTGEGLNGGSPILVLRNRLMSRREFWAIRNNADKEALAASIIKAWNGWRRGETFESGWRALHWRNIGRSAEPFPVPQ